MADGMVYTIRLKLKVDDKEVDNAMRKVDRLNDKTIRARSGVGAGSRTLGYGGTNKWDMVGMGLASRYGNIPTSQYRMLDIINYRLARSKGLSNQNFLRNVNNAYGAFGTLKSRFLGNLANPAGWLRNLSNFGAAIGSIGKIAGAAVPALGALGNALGIIAAFKGFQMAGNLIPLWIGNKIMQSQGMTEGASNLMQFQMARKGLGPKYEESLKSATKIAGEYGFSRTGILNSINMLSGLNIGKRTLSREEATRIATQAGKISNLGGVPFERVNINMQQLLGQPTPSTRDLRELIQAAPIIGKIAQQSMASKGKSGDIFAYLKDKANLLQVLNDFDKMIESNPFMKARGAIALSKENFFMDIVNQNSDVWPKIAEGMETFYKGLVPIVNDLLKRLSNALNSGEIEKSMKELRISISNLLDFASFIGKTFRFFYDKLAGEDTPLGRLATRGSSIIGSWATGKSGIYHYRTFSVGENGEMISQVSNDWSLGKNYAKSQQEKASQYDAEMRVKKNALMRANIPTDKWDEYLANNKYWKALFPYDGAFFPSGFRLKSKAEMDSDIVDPLSLSTNATDELADVTKGQKSLIINFNREIVNMPVNIDTVNDGSDLVSRLDSMLPDMIVRGMSIALNNATGAI